MFPAYSDDAPRRIAPPEHGTLCDEEMDFSGRYSSFLSKKRESDEAEEQKIRERKERKEREAKQRRKQEELERMMSQHSVKMISIYSDDDSDIDIPMEVVIPAGKKEDRKRSKKRHKTKRSKRRRRRSSSPSSSSSSSSSNASTSSGSSKTAGGSTSRPSLSHFSTGQDKWSFMTTFNPNDASTFFIMDMKADNSNFHYESLYKGTTSKYIWLLHKVLGGDDNLQKIMFDSTEQKKAAVHRYYHEKVRKSWNTNPERLWRRKSLKPMTEYIELSNYALTESDLQDESGNLKREKCEEVDGGISLIEANPETKSQKYNAELSKDKHNIDLWLKFLATQDEIFLARDDPENARKSKAERLTDRALLDRKMTILDKAISFNFDSVILKLERLKIGIHLWEEEQWNREVENVEFKHKNDPQMWKGILDLFESDTRRFKLSTQLKKMQKCLNKLSEVMSGQLVTHPPMPNTESFIVSVIRRRIQLLFKCGHTEKAIATAQAVCEFNLCMPTTLEFASLEEKRKVFEVFWDSGIARIGDENAKGWANAMDEIKNGKVTTDSEQFDEEQAVYEKLERETCIPLQSKDSTMPYRAIWREIEKLRTKHQWKPVRDVETKCDDMERFVAAQDITDVLQPLSRSVATDLLFDILEDFGAIIYGRDTLHPTNIMNTFVLFPDLALRWEGFDQFVCRFMELASLFVRERRDILLSSLLLTTSNFLKQNDQINDKARLKKFREEAKSLVRKENNISNITLMATYAEEMLKFGEKGLAKACAEKFLTQDLWSLKNRPRLISLLRMAFVYVCASDESEKRSHLANIAFNGRPGTDLNFDAQLVERKYNHRLTILLKEGEANWEGSAIDITSTLALLFAYHYAEEEKRVQTVQKVYRAMTKVLGCDKKLFFMKNYVNLLRQLVLSRPFEPPSFLLDVIATAVNNFPTNIQFLKMYIEANAVGTRIIHLRRFLEENNEDEKVNVCRAFGAVYLELLRHKMLLETSEKQSPELHRLRAILQKSSALIAHRDDSFWRLMLRIENERGDDKRAREVFYLAYTDCPWSKALILDYKNVNAGEHEKLLDAIVEKELRLRCHLEEIAIILQTFS